MAEAPGKPVSSRELEVLGNIAKHFNNSVTSDLTLAVGDQSYYVHRVILSAQSSVFNTMLMNRRWKDSGQKLIELHESPACKAVFGDFLNFFYSGRLTLRCDNVCAIHMLADKYDMTLLKEDAVTVMKNVLMGLQGKAHPSAVVWLPYIEKNIPDLLSVCYDDIRTNFNEIATCSDDETTAILEPRHINVILAENGSDVVVPNELVIFQFVSKWAKLKFTNPYDQKAKEELKPILESIRFNNINAEGLQEIEQSLLFKANSEFFLNPAYKVHSQIHSASMDGQETSAGNAIEGKHAGPFDSDINCQSLNPRLYTGVNANFDPGKLFVMTIMPVDFADLQMYAQSQSCLRSSTKTWTLQLEGNYQRSQVYENEMFTLTPILADIGRNYTVAVTVAVFGSNKCLKYRYALKHTGTVKVVSNHRYKGGIPEPITLHSPKRDIKTTTDGGDELLLGVTLHLHKQ